MLKNVAPSWSSLQGAQGVIFPAGVREFPAGNLQNPQEILTKTLIVEQIHVVISRIITKQAGAELCQAQVKLEVIV